MKGRICEADVVHVESFLSFLPAGPLLRPPTVPHRKVKPGNYSMHLSKLLNKHKTIETRALDVNSIACSRWMQISLTMITKMATRPR